MEMMGSSTLLIIVGVIALGFFVIRFGKAMNDLEQRVSDIKDRLDAMSSS